MNASSSSLAKKYDSSAARTVAGPENANAFGKADPYSKVKVVSPHQPLSYRIIVVYIRYVVQQLKSAVEKSTLHKNKHICTICTENGRKIFPGGDIARNFIRPVA
jgi:hypothetical protein